MDTRKMAKEYRLSQWAQIIQARKESGKSVKDFCAEEGVNKNAYFYWQRKLREVSWSRGIVTPVSKVIKQLAF